MLKKQLRISLISLESRTSLHTEKNAIYSQSVQEKISEINFNLLLNIYMYIYIYPYGQMSKKALSLCNWVER